jgi:undecaprenyl-phosphate 4-deoxy-4-formamido-L-arabinose transferase
VNGRKRGHQEDAVPEFSVIICCYNEEQSLPEFYQRLSQALEGLARTYEIVFVNDGSRDATFDLIRGYFDADTHICAGLDLYHNSGQAAAITAGLRETIGDKIILLDSDLQLDPEDLPRLVAESDKGFDLVNGHRIRRHDAWWRRLGSVVHNRIVRRTTGIPFKDFGCTFKIIDGNMMRAFEYGPFKPVRPVATLARAQRYCEVPVAHHPRRYGRSGWTPRKFLGYISVNLIPNIEGPLRWAAALLLLGALLITGCVLFAGESSSNSPAFVGRLHGLWLHLAQTLSTFGGLSLVGILILRESRRRLDEPVYIIREALRRSQENLKVETKR